MAAANSVDLESRAAYTGPDIAVEMAADELHTRSIEGDAARCLPVEIGVAAVRIQNKAEADEDAARPGAGIFARSQVGGGGRYARECEQNNGQPSRRPPRMYSICHVFPLLRKPSLSRCIRSVNHACSCHIGTPMVSGLRLLVNDAA